MSLAANIIKALLTNHFEQTRLVTPLTDKHYSLPQGLVIHKKITLARFACLCFVIILLLKVHNKRQNLHIFQLKWLICVEKFCPFSLFTSNNLDHTFGQGLKRIFVNTVQSIQGNSCLYHCRPVLNVSNDVLTEFKHSKLSHFALQTSIYNTRNQQRKGKLLCEHVFISKLNLKKEVAPAGCLGMFFLSPEDESWLPEVTSRCQSTALYGLLTGIKPPKVPQL